MYVRTRTCPLNSTRHRYCLTSLALGVVYLSSVHRKSTTWQNTQAAHCSQSDDGKRRSLPSKTNSEIARGINCKTSRAFVKPPCRTRVVRFAHLAFYWLLCWTDLSGKQTPLWENTFQHLQTLRHYSTNHCPSHY